MVAFAPAGSGTRSAITGTIHRRGRDPAIELGQGGAKSQVGDGLAQGLGFRFTPGRGESGRQFLVMVLGGQVVALEGVAQRGEPRGCQGWGLDWGGSLACGLCRPGRLGLGLGLNIWLTAAGDL